MSMKRILGMMLASRMAGRGTRSGIGGGIGGGGLGGMAAAGLLGGRRSGLGRKAGLAALGYMAYRAYQDHSARTGGSASSPAAGSGGSSTDARDRAVGSAASSGGVAGALGGIVKSVSDALTGQQGEREDRTRTGAPAETSPDSVITPDDQRAAETFSEDTALLLIRAMITAANADGTISAEERARILAHADQAGAEAEDRRALEQELANPRPLDELLGKVREEETAEEFYLASRMAVADTTDANRAYLNRLRERLGLAEQQAAEIDSFAS
jgi:uncharacterized membrane protein YebE (DUF533 family)